MSKKNIKLDDIRDERVTTEFASMWRRAESQMKERTNNFEWFTKISHNRNLYENRNDRFSEGSTQAMKRKIRNQTIQRVPDGEIVTQFDKNTIEQVEIEYLFKNKILASEFAGSNMLTNLTKLFNNAYDYGFGCVRTDFVKDLNNDYRISFNIINWADVYPAPDHDDIASAPWYIIRESVSHSQFEQLVDDKGLVKDKTYNQDAITYILENKAKGGLINDMPSQADRDKMITKIESLELRTIYKRGDKEFITYAPSLGCIVRTVKNEDPRLDVPIHFLILEPDNEYPLGASIVMYTLAQQQFADAFQSSAYQTLLLALNPPLTVRGNITASSIKYEPRAFIPMGRDVNSSIEPLDINTAPLANFGSICENISANMMKTLNITDGTPAADANVHTYSATPQGVEQQRMDKTITINSYQKQIEIFFSEWSCHALRSYLSSMKGSKWLTVDEETRRRIWDIEMVENQPQEVERKDKKTGKVYTEMIAPKFTSIIDGNKININFTALSADTIEFVVRTGSLIESQIDQERSHLQEAIVSISQMIGNVSDQAKPKFEEVLVQMTSRILELSNIDISKSTSAKIDEVLLSQAMEATMQKVSQQDNQIQQLAQNQMAMQQQLNPNRQQSSPNSNIPEDQMPNENIPQPPMPAGNEQQVPPVQGNNSEVSIPAEAESGSAELPEEVLAG